MPRRRGLRPRLLAAVVRSKATLAFAAERQVVGRTAMATIWFEDFDPLKHRNPMRGEVGTPPGIERHYRARTLEPHRVILVRVEGFTFEFHSLEQIQACLRFYQQKRVPSGRIPLRQLAGGDHWEFQRWYERLPGELRRDSKRLKVVRALEEASRRAVQPAVAADGAAPRG